MGRSLRNRRRCGRQDHSVPGGSGGIRRIPQLSPRTVPGNCGLLRSRSGGRIDNGCPGVLRLCGSLRRGAAGGGPGSSGTGGLRAGALRLAGVGLTASRLACDAARSRSGPGAAALSWDNHTELIRLVSSGSALLCLHRPAVLIRLCLAGPDGIAVLVRLSLSGLNGLAVLVRFQNLTGLLLRQNCKR